MLSNRPVARMPIRAARAAAGRFLALALFGTVGGCAPVPQTPDALPVPAVARDARILATRARLECVPYARKRTGISIRGDAGTWWDGAVPRYRRGHKPAPGAVAVFRRKGGSSGHLAVVTRVVGARLIVVDHANWLNDGRIHQATPVTDVSADGDWSEVRVWHTPGRRWGTGTYGLYGFVYPERLTAGRRGRALARE